GPAMRSFSLAPGLVSSSQIGVMIGSHHAGDSTMVPKASRSWGGLSAAMGTVRPSAPVCVPSMRRLTLPSGSIPAGFGKMKRWVSVEDLCDAENSFACPFPASPTQDQIEPSNVAQAIHVHGTEQTR